MGGECDDRDTQDGGGVLAWLAQTLRVLSRRMTRRTFLDSRWASRRTSPVPRSFHSDVPTSKRKSFARLVARATR